MGKRSSFEVIQSDISSKNGDTKNVIKEDKLISELKEEVTDMEDSGVEEDKVNVEKIGVEERRFCYGEEEKERFNRILKHYVGSHNFHNFTTRTKAEDPAARRYIVSFHANTVVTVEGIDFVSVRDVNIIVPTAPEVGLHLEECLFPSYNQKWKDSHEELSMKAFEEEAKEFKMKFIYSHIASTEHEEGVVALWLHSLNHRNYPDLRVRSADTIEGKSPKVDESADTTEEKSNTVEKNGDMIEGKSPKVDEMQTPLKKKVKQWRKMETLLRYKVPKSRI
ncbi:hypothetical protein REPUB_Repub03eG0180900 [Reevesia pubescens]